VPAQGFTEEKGGLLAFIERTIREIPQRCLTTTRFIDAEHGYPLTNVYRGKKCIIRSPGNQTTLEDMATTQEVTEIIRCVRL
jgi:hypothetical protein